ncbi:MAG: hypothetical protein AAGD06_00595 [Acidobacteriota bacterium]
MLRRTPPRPIQTRSDRTQAPSAVALTLAAALLIPAVASAVSQTNVAVPAERCWYPQRPADPLQTTAQLAPPRLTFIAATVGLLHHAADSTYLIPVCGANGCELEVSLGFVLPTGPPPRATLVVSLGGVPEGAAVDVQLVESGGTAGVTFPAQLSIDPETGDGTVTAPALPVGEARFDACGLLEIRVTMTHAGVPPSPMTGSDTLLLREVTLGPE